MKQRLRNLPESGHMIKTETKKGKYSRFKAIFDESNASGLISLKGDAESTTWKLLAKVYLEIKNQ